MAALIEFSKHSPGRQIFLQHRKETDINKTVKLISIQVEKWLIIIQHGIDNKNIYKSKIYANQKSTQIYA